MQIKLGAALAVGALAITCSSHHSKTPGSEEKAIIGTNDFIVEQDSSLRQLVGKLSLTDKSCTAFVTGTNEITTAAHCLQTKDEVSKLQFTTGSGLTTSITNIIQLEPTMDGLILGTEVTFQSSLAMGSLQGNSLKIVGFDSGKNELLTNVDCRFENRIAGSGVFAHSCDTIPGMSRSPILQSGKVVGIHLGYVEKIDQNAAYEVALLGDETTNVATIGIFGERGTHIRNRTSLGNLGGISEILDGRKKIVICGFEMQVPVVSYALCQVGAAVLPVNCTAAAAATGGGSCAANFAGVAATCVVSMATIGELAQCCIKGGC